MKTALVLTHGGSLLEDLRLSLADAGFTVASFLSTEELLRALHGMDEAAASLVEARRETFTSSLKPIIRVRPELPVYMIDGGAVFCRYPMRSHQPDIVAALRNAGVRLSERLLTGSCGDIPRSADPAFLV
jgi:hypothetical protein